MIVPRPQHRAGRVVAGAGAGLAVLAALLAVTFAFEPVTGCEITTSGTAIDGCRLSDDVMAAAAVTAMMIVLGAVIAGPVLLLVLLVAGVVCLVRRRW